MLCFQVNSGLGGWRWMLRCLLVNLNQHAHLPRHFIRVSVSISILVGNNVAQLFAFPEFRFGVQVARHRAMPMNPKRSSTRLALVILQQKQLGEYAVFHVCKSRKERACLEDGVGMV